MANRGICIVGPLLGSNKGYVISQGEILTDHLRHEGFDVLATSSRPQRWRRIPDILFSLIRHRRRYDVAVVMVFSGRAFWVSWAAATLARALRKKSVLWLHGGDLPGYLADRPSAAKWLSEKGDHLVSPSDYLLRALPEGPTPATIIRNIVPAERISFRLRREPRPRILWMRTFHPLYRPLLAIETLRALNERGVRPLLTMAGQEKGMGPTLTKAVEEAGLTDQVRVVGFLDEQRKSDAFSTHDIYLNTTATDNFPVSLIEAAAAGLPVVTTGVGGIPSVFTHEVDGMVVETSDPNDLADAIVQLLQHASLAERISEAGRRLAASCTWPAVAPAWISLLDDLLGYSDKVARSAAE